MNAPNAKTAAAARMQAPVVANNIMVDMGKATGVARYNGYGSCPLTVEHGKIILAEFGYGGKLLPSLPGWIINGQKIWTSAGHLADHIFTLARTDPDSPKHKGISFLLVDMRQPGIEVRPIKMISGESEFNEVFYTDATTPKDQVVGGVNNGWAVAMGLLGFERGEAAATAPIRFAAEVDRLLALAKERGVNNDPRMRQKLAWCYSQVQVMKYLGMRTLTKFLAGHHPGPDGAIFKLFWSEYHKIVTEIGVDILGMDALVPSGRKPSSAFQTDDAGAPNDSMSWAMTFLNARAGTIYAGSSQIQRNIIGEMVLGLPKEPKPG